MAKIQLKKCYARKTMRYHILIITLFLSLNVFASENVVVESYGLYGAVGSKRVPEQGSPTGYTNEVERFYLVEATKEVSMKIGETFGLKYRVDEGCGIGSVIDQRITVPNAGMVRPQDNSRVSAIIGSRIARCGEQYDFMFSFDEEWELVPGKWIFSIGSPSKTLVSIEFNIK